MNESNNILVVYMYIYTYTYVYIYIIYVYHGPNWVISRLQQPGYNRVATGSAVNQFSHDGARSNRAGAAQEPPNPGLHKNCGET